MATKFFPSHAGNLKATATPIKIQSQNRVSIKQMLGLSIKLITKKIRVLTFRALALRRVRLRSDTVRPTIVACKPALPGAFDRSFPK